MLEPGNQTENYTICESNRFLLHSSYIHFNKPQSWSDDEMREGHIQYDDFYLSNERFISRFYLTSESE